MSRVVAVLAGDLRNMRRDPMLLLVLVAPLFVLVLLRLGVPAAERLLQQRAGLDLAPYRPLALIFFTCLPSLLFGLVVGLLMLDEQDDGILRCVAVTPLRREGYLAVKLAAPALGVLGLSYLFVPLSGLGTLRPLRFFPSALMLALETLLLGLALVTLAENKVEGLALGKALGVYVFGPLVGALVPAPWKYLGAVSPAWWVSETFLADGLRPWALLGLVGLAVHGILFALLLRRFREKMFTL
jgi:fluoroquinolone transport system permease protein